MPNFRYEGERNSQYRERIQEVVEFILSKDYGETILHTELANMLHYNIDIVQEEKKYKSTMARIKNFLLEYGYVLKSINGLGFYILKPTQVSQHCYRNYVKRAGRMYDKSEYILEHVEQLNMSDDRKEEIEKMMEMNKQIIENVWNTIKDSAYYSRKDYYNSLED